MFEIIPIISHAVVITVFVFVMMLLVDYFNVATQGRVKKVIKGSKARQYTIASFLGSTPGCLGAFLNVSLYVHGLLTFGAIAAGMIATSGDEAFVMLAMFPKEALILFALLFVLGIVGGWIADKFASFFHIKTCEECDLQKVHDVDEKHYFQPSVLKDFPHLSPFRYGLIFVFIIIILLNLSGFFGPQSWDEPEKMFLISLSGIAIIISATVSKHYLKDHVVGHIIKKHIWKVFLWTFFALLFVEVGLQYWNLEGIITANLGVILIISALVGLIPESGPHLVFVTMFASGMVPFSVLLTSSIVQDGHGMIPLFSYTAKDSIRIKIFNLMFGLAIGIPLYLIGL